MYFISSHTESEIGSNLIVVPNNLLKQWCEEFSQYIEDTEDSDFAVYSTNKRARDIRSYRIVLTTYDTVLSDSRRGDNSILENYWSRIFIDEAHEIRNPKSMRNKVINKLEGKSKWCLTGTPIWNNASDLQSLKKFVSQNRPDLVTKDFIHIRTKEVLTLPKYNLIETECKFTGKQFKEYKNFERKMLRASLKGEGKKKLLGNIIRLRRLCNHTAGDKNSENMEEWGSNAKFTKTMMILSSLPQDEKIVIFSSWVTTLMSLKSQLVSEGYNRISMFHGEMDMADRQKNLQDFRNGENNILLISVKCGGVGLNLVCANHIVVFEPQYSPFSEKQAIDRVFRIGQKKEVFVYRFYLKFSIEHWMNSIKDWKNVIKRVQLDDSTEDVGTAFDTKIKMFQRYVILQPQIEKHLKIINDKNNSETTLAKQTE